MTVEELIKELEKMKKIGKMKEKTLVVMRTLNSQGSFVAIDVGGVEVTKTVGPNQIEVVVLQNKKKEDTSALTSFSFGKLMNLAIKPFK